MTLFLGVMTVFSVIRLFFFGTQIMIVRRRVAVVSYINSFSLNVTYIIFQHMSLQFAAVYLSVFVFLIIFEVHNIDLAY